MIYGLFLVEVIDLKIKIRAFDPITGKLHTMPPDIDHQTAYEWLKSINSSVIWVPGL